MQPQRRREMRESRGTFTEAGKESYRDRSVQENLDLFTRMRQGEFADALIPSGLKEDRHGVTK